MTGSNKKALDGSRAFLLECISGRHLLGLVVVDESML